MLSIIVAFSAFLLFFYGPIVQILNRAAPQMRRLARPQLNEDVLALEMNQSTLECGPDAYAFHVFSREPLVIYIERFLNAEERSHLLEISEPIYKPSTVTHDGGDSIERDTSVRKSEVAVVPRTGMVQCIEARARSLQGWRDQVWLERLRVQRYRPGDHYGHHFDWSSNRGGWGRVSSFMAWVDDGDKALKGGGTEFPLLRKRDDGRWCAFVECAETEDGKPGSTGDEGTGVVFRVIPGNAVYWENFRCDGTGRGYDGTWHAGLRVLEGSKVGLNIWSFGRLD